MSHFLRTAAEVVGVAIAIAAAIPTGGGSVAVGGTLLSSALGVSAATASAIAAGLSVGIAGVEALTAKKPAQLGNPEEWQSDPQAGIPHVIGRMYTGGQIVLRETSGDNNMAQSIHTIYSTGPIMGFESLYVSSVATGVDADGNADIVDKGKLVVATQLGRQPEPSAFGFWDSTPGLSASSKLSGLAAGAARLYYDTKGGHTLTTEPQLGYVVLGTPVYDPRKDSTYPGGNGTQRWNDETTWSFTGYDNPGLKGISFLIGYRQSGKLVIGPGIPLTGINLAQLVEMANVCDANGWKLGGIINSTDDPWQMYTQILQAGGAVPTRTGTITGAIVNTPKVSLATFERDDIIGPWSIQATQSRRDRINSIVPRYMAEQSLVDETTDANGNTVLQTMVSWGIAAAGAIEVAAYVTADGEERQKEVDYPFVTGVSTNNMAPNQVAQLARYDIENAREFGPISLPMKPRWMGYRAGDVITGGASLTELGLVGQDIMLLQRQFSPANMTVTFTARSETAAKHAFALGQTTIAPPTPSLSGPPLVPTPGNAAWALTAGTVASTNGTTGAALFLTGSSDSSVINGVIVEMRVDTGAEAAAADWEGVTTLDPSFSGQLTITGVQDLTSYQVAVSYRMGASTGARLILGPATAGQTSVGWSSGVTGPGKPQDSATVGAPAGTYVAGVLAEDLAKQVQDLQNQTGFDTTPPAVPTGLTATSALAANGTVDLTFTWTANTEADLGSYVLQVALNGGAYVPFPAAGNSYVFHGLQPNTPFMAQVAAVDTSGNVSGFSTAYSGTTTKDTVPPAAPTGLTVSPGINSVFLNAVAPADADTVAIRFWASADEIFAHASPVGIVNALPGLAVGRTTQQNSGSTVYYFATALDSSGNEGASVGPAQGSTYSLSDADFTPGLYPTRSYTSLAAFPASTGSGRIAFSQADGKLYRDTASGWTAQVSGVDITDGTLYGSKIVAGTVSVVQLAAGAVTASKLGVLGNSLNPDPGFQDHTLWHNVGSNGGEQGLLAAGYASNGWYVDNITANSGDTGSTLAVSLYDGNPGWLDKSQRQFLYAVSGTYIPVVAGKSYELSGTCFNTSNQYSCLIAVWTDSTGKGVGTPLVVQVAASAGLVSPVPAGVGTAPTGASSCYLAVYNQGTGTGFGGPTYQGTQRWANVQLREQFAGTAIIDGTLVAAKIAVGTLTGDRFQAGTITGNLINSATSLPGSITVGLTGFSLATIQSVAANPAAAINANTTLITPGKISLSGSTTLTSWIYGGDNTSINGGAVAANTISANKLTIGHRNINWPGLTFQIINGGASITWPNAFVQYTDDNGNFQQLSIVGGTSTPGNGYWYIYWTEGATALGVTNNPGVASQEGYVCLATWVSGTYTLVQNFGGTIIDGSQITTGSIAANKLSVIQLSAITADIGTISAGVLVSQRGLSELDLNNGRIIFNSGSMMKVVGEGFGTSSQFVEWAGPSMDPSLCSEANAISYLRTDGSAYFGGALSAGILKNAVQSSSTAANASVDTGPFGSNGHARQVVLSYTYSATYSIAAGGHGAYSGSTSATVQLRNGSGAVLATLNVTGSVSLQQADATDVGFITETMSGSVTYTDSSGGTTGEYVGAITARSTVTATGTNGLSLSQRTGVVSTES